MLDEYMAKSAFMRNIRLPGIAFSAMFSKALQ